ncbi:hypothetical protein V495_00888 [Pseudogymnoascus sp. VKM F-4514 (FW-929)]|nr:hypothetical protein V495_00888 [Pseudogymnoascus sp. VKM F-4514 (FW-929)]KFY57632.1 hypothetical protein V497_05387 [Pseudogymnoascus sp. VKM F-4516 (FW-969)]
MGLVNQANIYIKELSYKGPTAEAPEVRDRRMPTDIHEGTLIRQTSPNKMLERKTNTPAETSQAEHFVNDDIIIVETELAGAKKHKQVEHPSSRQQLNESKP